MPRVLTVEKCFDLLECLAARDGGMGTRELARSLGVNVTTVHNIATTLVSKGYLEQDERTRRFRIGTRFLLMGQHARLHESLMRTAHPLVVNLAAKLNESVMLAMLEHGRAVNIDYVPSSQALRVHEPEVLGSLAYCTAVGKIMLASMTQAELEAYVQENPPQRHTAATLTQRAAILAAIAEVRNAGYAETRDELVEGGSALAVPVLDPNGRTVAALGASAPTIRLEGAERKRTLDALRVSARKITEAWFRREGLQRSR
jgi:DNA-binding IclR family transcriptional regulator